MTIGGLAALSVPAARVIASVSMGSITTAFTFLAIRSSTSLVCLFGSAAVVMTWRTPLALAWSCAFLMTAPIQPWVADGNDMPMVTSCACTVGRPVSPASTTRAEARERWRRCMVFVPRFGTDGRCSANRTAPPQSLGREGKRFPARSEIRVITSLLIHFARRVNHGKMFSQ